MAARARIPEPTFQSSCPTEQNGTDAHSASKAPIGSLEPRASCTGQAQSALGRPMTLAGVELLGRLAAGDPQHPTVAEPQRPSTQPACSRVRRGVKQPEECADAEGTISARLGGELDLDPLRVEAVAKHP